MDFNNYNDETEEELYPHESKTHKRIKFAFRYSLYGISFLVWGILLYLIFSTNDPSMFNDMYFSDEAHALAEKNPDSFTIYTLQPTVDMNDLGTIQLDHIYYADTVDELEIGVKFNMDKITSGKLENSLVFVLTDSFGNSYSAVNIATDSNNRYGYARICFNNVSLDVEINKYYSYIVSYDLESEYAAMFVSNTSQETSEEVQVRAGNTYTLSIYSYDKIMAKGYATVSDGVVNIDYARFLEDSVTEIDSFKIYDNNTVITSEEFE